MVENVSLFKTQRFGSLKPGLNLDLFQQIVIEEEVKKCYSEVLLRFVFLNLSFTTNYSN